MRWNRVAIAFEHAAAARARVRRRPTGDPRNTPSAAPALIRDGEQGSNDHGFSNFAGDCDAKVANRSPTQEPVIFATMGRFGTVLENVVFDPRTRIADFDDQSLTESTGVCHPIASPLSADPHELGLHPSGVILTALGARIEEHVAQRWLVNTEWSGGTCSVGRHMTIAHTSLIRSGRDTDEGRRAM
jgi:ATP-dependent phosphoenolpyruvate carboxykinase